MWYVKAKALFAAKFDGPPCPDCGNNMMPSKFPKPGGEYYCGKCKAAKPGPSSPASSAMPTRQTPQPVSSQQSPPPSNSPLCKRCGQPFGMSKKRPTNHFCWNCYKNDKVLVEMKPEVGSDISSWPVSVVETGKDGYYTSFKGTYGSWMAPLEDVTPETPVNRPEMDEGVLPVTELPQVEDVSDTEETSLDDVIPDDELESEEQIIENQVRAKGEYSNGQPEADLVEGQIRIYSEEARNRMFAAAQCDACGKITRGGKDKCDFCGADVESIGEPLISSMTESLIAMTKEVMPGVENYVELAPFFAQARADLQDGKALPGILMGPRKTPIILDQSVEDQQAFIQEVVQNPLYAMTEIGSKGYTPNISQATVIDVLANTMKNLTICLPTGAGKTTCAEVAIAKGLSWGKTKETEGRMGLEKPVAVYIAPARALTAQVAKDFSVPDHPFKSNGWGVRMEMGGSVKKEDVPDDVDDASESDDDVSPEVEVLRDTQDPSIILVTPERLLTCLQNPSKHEWVRRVTTFIFDEGHLIGDDDRGPKFQAEQIKLYEMFKAMKSDPRYSSSRVMFMSATMDNALELSSWQDGLVSDSISNVDLERMTPEQRQQASLRSNWALAWGETKPVHINRKFAAMPSGGPDSEREEAMYMVDLVKSSLGKRVMLKEPDGKRREIIAPTLFFAHSKKTAWKLQSICKDYFRQCLRCGAIFPLDVDRDGNPIERKIWEESCACGASNRNAQSNPRTGKKDWVIVPFAPGFHHRGATGKDRLLKDFNSFKAPFLIATSTLAAGVNIGAWEAHILGASRGHGDVDVASILQMAGRAGRQSFARLFEPVEPEIDQVTGEEVPFGANVTFHVDPSRFLYHARRIQAGTCLEGGLANDIHYPDVLLLFVNMGLIKNVSDAGRYLGKSFDFLQSEVDRKYPMNPRLGLKQISQSVDQEGKDTIEDWHIEREEGGVIVEEPPPSWCKHISIGFDWDDVTGEIESARKAREMGESPASDNPWIVHCKDCGAIGMLQNRQRIRSEEEFSQVADSSLRDLIGAGFLVCDMETGDLKITPLGQDLAKKQVQSATVVDIIRNMSKLRIRQDEIGRKIGDADDIEIAEALTRTRPNNDEERGAFITVDQTHNSCIEACMYLYGKMPFTIGPNGQQIPIAAPDPFIKTMQCVYWLLTGKDPQEIFENHRDMAGDYKGVSEDYGGMLMAALSHVFDKAGWFSENGSRMTSIKTQLSKGVGPEEAVFAIANNIGQKRASSLRKAGFLDLNDIVSASPSDFRFALHYYHLRDIGKKNPNAPIPTRSNPIVKGMDEFRVKREIESIKKLAADALSGKTKTGFDSSYKKTVQSLNNPDWLAWISSKRSASGVSSGWFRSAKKVWFSVPKHLIKRCSDSLLTTS